MDLHIEKSRWTNQNLPYYSLKDGRGHEPRDAAVGIMLSGSWCLWVHGVRLVMGEPAQRLSPQVVPTVATLSHSFRQVLSDCGSGADWKQGGLGGGEQQR